MRCYIIKMILIVRAHPWKPNAQAVTFLCHQDYGHSSLVFFFFLTSVHYSNPGKPNMFAWLHVSVNLK